MDKMLKFSSISLIIWIAAILPHAESQQPTMTWDMAIPGNCQSTYYPICYETDPTATDWDVTITCPDHPDGETDSITVEYSDYPADQDDRDLEREQLVLQCTGENENQIQMDVFCQLDAFGGGVTAEGPYTFTNLSAAGVLPGWTCTVLGCFTIYKPARGEREYFKAPDVQCTDLQLSVNSQEEPTKETTHSFDLHNELAYQVKAALDSNCSTNVSVTIELPFDLNLFTEGLQRAGKISERNNSRKVYTVGNYSSLAEILGEQWHLRVINKEMDFCYVVKETVRFYLLERESIENAVDPSHRVEDGHMLVFSFVRGSGGQSKWDEITKKP